MIELHTTNGSANGSASPPDDNVAISPSAPEQLASLVREIESQAKSYARNEPEARLKLVGAAQSLVQSMETPRETMLRYCWAQVRRCNQIAHV